MLNKVNPQLAEQIGGNTAGVTALLSSGTVTLCGGNNITLSQNGSAITISGGASQTVQTQNCVDGTLAGNTAGALALISSGTMTIAGGNNITLSQAGNAFTISGANQSVQTQLLGSDTLGMSNIGNTSGTTGVVTGSNVQLVLAGGNNITLSQSINGSSATITIAAFNQSVQTQNNVDVTAAGNTTGTLALVSSGTLTLAGGNNITLSQNGNAITISGPNAAGAQTGISSIAGAGGTQTVGMVSFINSNGVTFGMSTGANTGSMTASVAAQSVQTQNCVDVTAAGNTTGTLVLVSSGTLTLAGGNNITLSQGNNNAITISAFNQSSQSAIGGLGASNTGNTAGNTGISTGIDWVVAGTNGVTVSESTTAGGPNTIWLSGGGGGGGNFTAGVSNLGQTSGSTGAISAQLILVGTNGIGLSGSTAGGGGASATVSIQPAPYHSMYGNTPVGVNTGAPGGQFNNGCMIVMPQPICWPVTATKFVHWISMSVSSSSNSSHGGTMSFSAGIYTFNASTLSLLTSGSATWAWTNTSNNSMNSLTGMKRLTCSMNMNLTPNMYWFAIWSQTSTANANWFTANNFSGAFAQVAPNGEIGQSSGSESYFMGRANNGNSFNSAMPSSIGTGGIEYTGNVRDAVPFAFQLENIA